MFSIFSLSLRFITSFQPWPLIFFIKPLFAVGVRNPGHHPAAVIIQCSNNRNATTYLVTNVLLPSPSQLAFFHRRVTCAACVPWGNMEDHMSCRSRWRRNEEGEGEQDAHPLPFPSFAHKSARQTGEKEGKRERERERK